MWKSIPLQFTLAAILVAFVGCGGSSNPKTFPVTGTVTHRNAPLQFNVEPTDANVFDITIE